MNHCQIKLKLKFSPKIFLFIPSRHKTSKQRFFTFSRRYNVHVTSSQRRVQAGIVRFWRSCDLATVHFGFSFVHVKIPTNVGLK